jgi:cytochrome c oxidase subunit 1
VPNLIASLFAILIAASVFTLAYNLIISLVRGEPATADEWGAKTLEWRIPTPVPLENFEEELPTVTSLPYDYGTPVPVAEGAAPALPLSEAQPQPED